MKYKKTTIAIILVGVFSAVSAVLLLNGRKIPVSIIEDPARTRQLPQIRTPYNDGTEMTFIMQGSTLGQLTKTSTIVLAGTVASSQAAREDVADIQKDRFAKDCARAGLLFEIEVFPCKEIGGGPRESPARAFLPVYFNILDVPKIGDGVIIYVVDYYYSIEYHEEVHSYTEELWGYDFNDFRRWRKNLGYNRVNSMDRGVVNLHGEGRDDLLQIAEGYFKHLRGSDRNRMDYFWFLQGLTTNANERVRLDSRTDAIYLLKSCTFDELRTIAASENIDPQFREYAEAIIKSNQQSSK